MSTNDSIGRTASTQTKVRSAYKPKKNRSHNLCAFTFADTDHPEDSEDPPAPAPKTSPQSPASASAPTAKPAASPAPQPSAQPAPSTHTPLPPTITEFFQQVMAGRNSSPSEIPTPSGT